MAAVSVSSSAMRSRCRRSPAALRPRDSSAASRSSSSRPASARANGTASRSASTEPRHSCRAWSSRCAAVAASLAVSAAFPSAASCSNRSASSSVGVPPAAGNQAAGWPGGRPPRPTAAPCAARTGGPAGCPPPWAGLATALRSAGQTIRPDSRARATSPARPGCAHRLSPSGRPSAVTSSGPRTRNSTLTHLTPCSPGAGKSTVSPRLPAGNPSCDITMTELGRADERGRPHGTTRSAADRRCPASTRWAAIWPKAPGCSASRTNSARESVALLSRLGLSPGQSAIDLGCGPSGILDLLSDAVSPGGRVVGLDADPAAHGDGQPVRPPARTGQRRGGDR